MMRPTTTSIRLLPLLMIFLGATLVLWGCTDQSGPVEPLGTIETDGGAVLTGTVRDTEGRPAEGAVLALESMAGGQPLSLVRLLGGSSEIELAEKAGGIATTTSGKDGRYHFNGLAFGDYLLTSSLRDHQGDHQKINIPEFDAAAAGTTFVDIQLMPTGTLLGNAELENATDHSGTVVYIGGTSYVAVTDPAGDYSLTGVPIGSWMVNAMHAGYLNDDDAGSLAAAGDTTSVGAMFLPLNSNIAPTATNLTAPVVIAGAATNFDSVVDDLDGIVVLCEWDFENDGVFDWSASGNPASPATSHVYAAAGDYLAKLRVTDDMGAVGPAVVDVSVIPADPYVAIFVSVSGNDLDDGGHLTPVKTITQGLALAQTAGKDSVMVASGTYDEDLFILDGISIIGGRDPNQGWADDPGILSTVNGSNQAVIADSITLPTILEGLSIVSDDAVADGGSSVAVTIFNSSQLTLLGCTLDPGNGRVGLTGYFGNNGLNGSAGLAGMSGDCSQAITALGGSGGSSVSPGGDGGRGGSKDDGDPGSPGQGSSGGNGGSRGFTDDPGDDGGNGLSGGNGINGVGGTGGLPAGVITGNSWQPTVAGSGQDGTSGSGGGGGGGGGAQEIFFVLNGTGNGGGGGGGGGYAGTSGGGGQGGGASFGVLVINSTVSIENCTINGGIGGNGGFGGPAGISGTGGAGGPGGTFCLGDVGRGGNGGVGGDGGHGGGGGGGAGGPSYCIYADNGTVTGTNTLNVGSGGLEGGAGTSGSGGNPGTAGSAGLSGATNY